MFVPIVVGDIGANEVLDQAVFGTALAEINAAVADDNLGIDESGSSADKLRGAEIDVIANRHGPVTPRPSRKEEVSTHETEENHNGNRQSKREN